MVVLVLPMRKQPMMFVMGMHVMPKWIALNYSVVPAQPKEVGNARIRMCRIPMTFTYIAPRPHVLRTIARMIRRARAIAVHVMNVVTVPVQVIGIIAAVCMNVRQGVVQSTDVTAVAMEVLAEVRQLRPRHLLRVETALSTAANSVMAVPIVSIAAVTLVFTPIPAVPVVWNAFRTRTALLMRCAQITSVRPVSITIKCVRVPMATRCVAPLPTAITPFVSMVARQMMTEISQTLPSAVRQVVSLTQIVRIITPMTVGNLGVSHRQATPM